MARPPDDVFLVVDLDDTLYLERDFAFSGYRAADAWARAELGLAGLEAVCRALFAAGVRRRIFDMALPRLGAEADRDTVVELVAVYRQHAPQISLAPDAVRLVKRWRGGLGLISDGPAATQAAKVRALGLDKRLDHVVLTGALGPGAGKPSPSGYLEIQAATGLPSERHVYVADNPLKDFLAPRRLGWRTVMIERPERIHRAPPPTPAHAAHAWVTDLDALERHLPQDAASSGTAMT